jgi:hypothetical protein
MLHGPLCKIAKKLKRIGFCCVLTHHHIYGMALSMSLSLTPNTWMEPVMIKKKESFTIKLL